MKECYQNFDFKSDTLALIDLMNEVIEEYTAQGYRLTVRQLYYQMVARDVVPNTEKSYKRITGVVNDARLAGLMDWDVIEDRTREFIRRPRWASGRDLIDACAVQFHMDMWANQDTRVFCIVEKEALAGVLERVCRKWDIPLLAARGYPSGTVLREFCEADLVPAFAEGKQVLILHLGDHDPSGIDMTRDLNERIDLFNRGEQIELKRIALNMPQIQSQKPPPNPAKTNDPRFKSYMLEHGDESWELDALKPDYLAGLVDREVAAVIDDDAWQERDDEIEEIRQRIGELAEEI